MTTTADPTTMSTARANAVKLKGKIQAILHRRRQVASSWLWSPPLLYTGFKTRHSAATTDSMGRAGSLRKDGKKSKMQRWDSEYILTPVEMDRPVEELVEEGHNRLNRHQLTEAEELFHRVLEKPDYSTEEKHKMRVACLVGLSEVYTKRGRSMRHNELEWHRMYIHAISSQRKAIECCDHVILQSKDGSEWFQNEKNKAQNRLKFLEECVLRSLQDRIIPSTEDGALNLDSINMDWLDSFRSYYKQKCRSNRLLSYLSKESLNDLSSDEEEAEPTPTEPKEKKKINFEKVSQAIQKIVKQISEMKTIKIHPSLSTEEKLTLISPLSEDFDIFKQFAKAFNDESDGSVSPRENGTDMATQTMYILDDDSDDMTAEEAQLDGISRTEVVESSTDDHCLGTSWTSTCSIPGLSPSKSQRTLTEIFNTTSLTSQSSHTTRIKPNGEVELAGVLTVWRGYKAEDEEEPVSSRQSYNLHIYEELSPLTEIVGGQKDVNTDEDDDGSLSHNTPVSDVSLDLTLAHTLSNMADKVCIEKKLKEATILYKLALGMLQKEHAGNRALLAPIAHILKKLGVIKCMQSDFVGGCQLIEQAIRMHELSTDQDKQLHIANAWYELGNAFMSEKWQDATLYENVMKTVIEVLQNGLNNELATDDMDSDDDDSDCGDSYSISTQEAIDCYSKALVILREMPVHNDDTTKHLFVNVLTKIGDSTVMIGNYDHAVLYYEEALKLFKNIIGSATLENNAHVLCMLGTAQFFTTNYPKAISMYECANLLQQHIYGKEEVTFEVGFTLTMLGLSYHCMKHYHKCISWCLKAFEVYSFLFKDTIMSIGRLQRWFVTETLYTLGYSYGTLNFHDKALHYLKLSRSMLVGKANMDVKQCVKVLKACADEHVGLDDNESALQYYSEALEYSAQLGDEKSATALQNQLLNRMAGVHVSTKQYGEAAEYLKQALSYQKNVENTIKDDMVEIQRQLGLTYTMAGDMDRAIECYTECVEAYCEMPGSHNNEMAAILGSLGTLYHVQACIQEDNDQMLELLTQAEKHYEEAIELHPQSSVGVQYANYLYQQAQYADSLIAMLPFVHMKRTSTSDRIVYNGVEQAVLPEYLQAEVDDADEVILDSYIFAKFLAVLCYKQIVMTKDATDCLVDLVTTVEDSKCALDHSMAGYALLEMSLFEEAARSFAKAASLQHDKVLSHTNYWLAMCTAAYSILTKALWNILELHHKDTILDLIMSQMTERSHVYEEAHEEQPGSNRDSGYYDPNLNKKVEESDSWQFEPFAPESIHLKIQETKRPIVGKPQVSTPNYQELSSVTCSSFGDRGYYSSEYLEKQGLDESKESVCRVWLSDDSMQPYTQDETQSPETVLESPNTILRALQQHEEEENGTELSHDCTFGQNSQHDCTPCVEKNTRDTIDYLDYGSTHHDSPEDHEITPSHEASEMSILESIRAAEVSMRREHQQLVNIMNQVQNNNMHFKNSPLDVNLEAQDVQFNDSISDDHEREGISSHTTVYNEAATDFTDGHSLSNNTFVTTDLLPQQQWREEITPMEMSPDSESEVYTGVWSETPYSGKGFGDQLEVTSSCDLSSTTKEEASEDLPEEDTIWIIEETVDTPTVILQAMQTNWDNNNEVLPETEIMLPEIMLNVETKEPPVVTYETWTITGGSEGIENNPLIQTVHSNIASSTTGRQRRNITANDRNSSDITNGNGRHIMSSTIKPVDVENEFIVSNREDESWEVFETVEMETPPEVLRALLQAQQHVQ